MQRFVKIFNQMQLIRLHKIYHVLLFQSPKRKTSPKTKKRKKETEDKPTSRSIIKHHCKLCGAGFAQVNNYTRHLQTHAEHSEM